jgi:hypothetical protein
LREDKLTGDLGNVIEATSIGGRRSDFFAARKLAPRNLGLLQQYRHIAAQSAALTGRKSGLPVRYLKQKKSNVSIPIVYQFSGYIVYRRFVLWVHRPGASRWN